MFAAVCFSVLACGFAAPQHFRSNVWDTENGSNTNQHYSLNGTVIRIGILGKHHSDMNEIDSIFEQFKKQNSERGLFTPSDPNIQGNQYKLEFNLHGFKQEDITVKVKRGLLRVIADHSENGNERHFQSTRTLPAFVKPADISTEFNNGVFTVIFEPKNNGTQEPDHEKSEREKNDEDQN